MTTYFLKFANLCGLISFSIAGAIQGKRCYYGGKWLYFLPCVIFNAFGGGIIFRDLLLLRIFPSALSERKELYASIAIGTIIYNFFNMWKGGKNYVIHPKIFKSLLTLADGLGSGIYICSGINKALSYGMPRHICILSGIVSTCGGGFLASLWCGERIGKALIKNLPYKLIVAYYSIMYYQFIKNDISKVNTQVMTIVCVATLCVLNALRKSLIPLFRNNIYHIACINTIVILPCYIMILIVAIAWIRSHLVLRTKNKDQYNIKSIGTAILCKRTYHILLYK